MYLIMTQTFVTLSRQVSSRSHSGFVLLVITVFLKFRFSLPGVRFDPGGLARVVFLYLVLCIFVVIMCYKILLQYLLPVF